MCSGKITFLHTLQRENDCCYLTYFRFGIDSDYFCSRIIEDASMDASKEMKCVAVYTNDVSCLGQLIAGSNPRFLRLFNPGLTPVFGGFTNA